MGTRKNRLAKAVLTSTQNLCFEQKYEMYLNFLSENFQFLVVKFSIYLNRHVFVKLRQDHNQEAQASHSPKEAEIRNKPWQHKHHVSKQRRMNSEELQ